MPEVRLTLGDCLQELPKLETASVDCCITDPPFGARRPSARRTAGNRFADVEGNDAVHSDWLPEAFRVLSDGGALYCFACWDVLGEWKRAAADAGFHVRSCIVWDKGIHGLADLETCWAPQHELILFAAKGRHELRGKRPKDIIRAQRVDAAKLIHPYQKPLGIILPLIRASTDVGDTVLDCFAGSGTVGEACRRMDGHFIGYEIDLETFAIAERRLAAERAKGDLFANLK